MDNFRLEREGGVGRGGQGRAGQARRIHSFEAKFLLSVCRLASAEDLTRQSHANWINEVDHSSEGTRSIEERERGTTFQFPVTLVTVFYGNGGAEKCHRLTFAANRPI